MKSKLINQKKKFALFIIFSREMRFIYKWDLTIFCCANLVTLSIITGDCCTSSVCTVKILKIDL